MRVPAANDRDGSQSPFRRSGNRVFARSCGTIQPQPPGSGPWHPDPSLEEAPSALGHRLDLSPTRPETAEPRGLCHGRCRWKPVRPGTAHKFNSDAGRYDRSPAARCFRSTTVDYSPSISVKRPTRRSRDAQGPPADADGANRGGRHGRCRESPVRGAMALPLEERVEPRQQAHQRRRRPDQARDHHRHRHARRSCPVLPEREVARGRGSSGAPITI